MVFQDFDQIQERRKLERQRKIRKRVIIAVLISFVLVILVACAIFAVITVAKNKNKSSSSPGSDPKQGLVKSQKLIQTICDGTTYKDSCKTTLTNAAKKNPDSVQPKELLRYAIQAISDENQKVMKEAKDLNFHKEEEKAAFDVCKKVVEDAEEDLKKSVSIVNEIKEKNDVNVTATDINNWLSAVMSYAETCIDNFPDGQLKSDMNKSLSASKHLTSNSLAMVRQLSSFIKSMMETTGTARHLLEFNHENRRLLRRADIEKPDPNVTVAQDGSGKFSTISEALSAMPEQYEGRYEFIVYVLS